ncbi:MAG: thermonuclease family protein [Nitrospinota bacterium]|nr:thermonuclease family protein [Nitrospinota bacterium]
MSNWKRWITPLGLALAAIVAMNGPQAASVDSSLPTEAIVLKVFDGDTLLVESQEKRYKVRLLGIDTPEVDGPYTKAEPFGKAASQRTAQLALGRTVKLEYGGDSAWDRFGRLLAYVTLPDGTDLNRLLIQEGLAEAFHSTQYTRKALYHQEQAKAKQARRGIWSLPKKKRQG